MQVNNNQPSFGMAFKKPNTSGWTGQQINALARALDAPDIIEIGNKADIEIKIDWKNFNHWPRNKSHDTVPNVSREEAVFATASKANKTVKEKVKHILGIMPTEEGSSASISLEDREFVLAERFKDAIREAHNRYTEYLKTEDIATAKSRLDETVAKANAPIAKKKDIYMPAEEVLGSVVQESPNIRP